MAAVVYGIKEYEMLKRSIAIIAVLLALANGAAAKDTAGYYVTDKLKGYSKGEFVVLKDDDVNFRSAPENGKVLKVLQHHALLRVLDHKGDWLETDADGVRGYVYASFTGEGLRDELTAEDFDLTVYAALGERFDAAKAEASLGKQRSKTLLAGKKRWLYQYDKAELVVDKRKQTLEAIRILDKNYITMRGVSVGDNAGRAVGQYGEPDAVTYGVSGVCYEYFWQDEQQQPLRFALYVNQDSCVTGILLERLDKKAWKKLAQG